MRSVIVVLCVHCVLYAAFEEPFAQGYSMMSFGTTLQENRFSGRQPWVPACFAGDSLRFCVASSYCNFYDPMDNLIENDFRKAMLGFACRIKRICIKGSGSFFNALNIYEEITGFFSCGGTIAKHLRASVELEAARAGLVGNRHESEYLLFGGASVWVPWPFAAVSARCENVVLKNANHHGFAKPLRFSVGVHTRPHRFGSQGIVVSYEPFGVGGINLSVGEELFIHKNIGLTVAIASQPLMVGFGVTVGFPRYAIYSGFVHHPVLGWSQGVGMEYVWQEE